MTLSDLTYSSRSFVHVKNNSSVRHALIDLHWFPVRYRFQYILALMMYMAHTGQTTSYIKDAVTPISQDPTRRRAPPTPATTRYRD